MALIALEVMRAQFELLLAMMAFACPVRLLVSRSARSLARVGRRCVSSPRCVRAWRVTSVGLLAGKARHAAAGSCSLPF